MSETHIVVLHSFAPGCKRPITIDGKRYESRQKAFSVFDICDSTVYRFKREFGISEEAAISRAIDYRTAQNIKKAEIKTRKAAEYRKELERSKNRKAKEIFVYKGKTYKNYAECCNFYRKLLNISLNEESVKQRARVNKTSIQEQLEKTIKMRIKQKAIHRIKAQKIKYIQVNTREKAESISKLLGDRHEETYETHFRDGLICEKTWYTVRYN